MIDPLFWYTGAVVWVLIAAAAVIWAYDLLNDWLDGTQ